MKSDKEVHLIFKHECRAMLNDTLHIHVFEGNKTDVTCKCCNGRVGFMLPFGPKGTAFAAFASDSVKLYVFSLSHKAMWAGVRLTSPFSAIECRDKSDFFGSVQPAISADASTQIASHTAADTFPSAGQHHILKEGKNP